VAKITRDKNTPHRHMGGGWKAPSRIQLLIGQ
jgi:hypothetical protein